jgi:group I intron endonuclease
MNTYYVYAVIHRLSEDAYVGCSARLEVRWTEHKRQLTLGRHSSPRLQAAWDKDGETAFMFTILAVLTDVSHASAKRSELEWITEIGSYNEVKADTENQKFVLPELLRMQLAKQNRIRGRTPEQREIMRQHTKRRWADPELRKPMLAGLEQGNGFYKGMPSVRSAEQITEHAQHMKDIWADPERGAKLRNRPLTRWKDPEAKARHAEKMRAYHAKRRAAKE